MPAAPQLVEFPDALGFGAPLFVRCAWRDVGSDAVESDTAVCDLVMIDGSRCWAGPLQRRDLAGPLGDSWKDPANLRLLQNALSAPNSRTPVPFAGPRAEASWRRGEAETLELTVRFIYREGPVAAIQGAKFPSVNFNAAISKICEGVRNLQEEVRKQKDKVQAERGTLQERQEVLKRRLEILPKEFEAHEMHMLEGLCGVLNAQKRRCRSLWESTVDGPGLAAGAGAGEAAVAPTMSLEECLDREVPNLGPVEERDEPVPRMPAPAAAEPVESAPSMFSLSFDVSRDSRAENTFSIPLTLGMSAPHLSASSRVTARR